LPAAEDKYYSQNILFVGVVWETKGGPLLLEALRIVRKSLPNATVTVIGTNPTVNQPGVTVLGPLRRSEPAEYERLKNAYQRAGCLCLLSEFDAFPNVLLEAQYNGTPVVALDRQSRREAMIPGQTGVLAEHATPAAVAAAIIDVLQSPDRARQMGEQGRAFVASRFTWPIVSERIIEEIGKAMLRKGLSTTNQMTVARSL
jgi:glycosyltransferase involved in cell wall biosynthesis